jgi:hypothetical protein
VSIFKNVKHISFYLNRNFWWKKMSYFLYCTTWWTYYRRNHPLAVKILWKTYLQAAQKSFHIMTYIHPLQYKVTSVVTSLPSVPCKKKCLINVYCLWHSHHDMYITSYIETHIILLQSKLLVKENVLFLVLHHLVNLLQKKSSISSQNIKLETLIVWEYIPFYLHEIRHFLSPEVSIQVKWYVFQYRRWMYVIIGSHCVPLEGKFLLIALAIVRITLNVIIH